jgi:hypothetical protein
MNVCYYIMLVVFSYMFARVFVLHYSCRVTDNLKGTIDAHAHRSKSIILVLASTRKIPFTTSWFCRGMQIELASSKLSCSPVVIARSKGSVLLLP